ncbi:MAG: AAA family ATPase [Firmicutes bacterium]|nr:AAA family ATPase [Bacillota bacterium]
MIQIYACHAGTGKTTLARMQPHKYIDFVAMPYKYYLPNSPETFVESQKADASLQMRLDYPYNYIVALIMQLDTTDKILLIPPENKVLDYLRQLEIEYMLFYPPNTPESKLEYQNRYINRGNNQNFLDIFIGNWDDFIKSLENDECEKKIVIPPDKFLSDIVNFVL